MKEKINIKNLDCNDCANKLENLINSIDGVNFVTVSLINQKINVEYDENKKEDIFKKIYGYIEDMDCEVI